MSDIKKSYYAIIPANVRYDKELTPNAKLLYGEITALCNEKGFCWASNQYFSSLYAVSKKSISNWISQLAEKRYITVELIYKEGGKEILHRYIRLLPYPNEEKFHTPMEEKVKENNTIINNTVNTTLDKDTMSSKPDDASIPYKEIIEHLNNKADRSYKHSTGKTKTLIKARWNEEFQLDDFKKVIDNKVSEWKGTAMDKFLRPETLFGTKFEGYLNEQGGGPGNESEYDGYF